MPQSSVTSEQPGTPTPQARTAPSATEMYEAARLARNELRNQQDELQAERRRVREQIRSSTGEADTKGLEGRLAVLDARIADVEKQISAADQVVAARAAVPGVVINPPPNNADPTEVIGMGMGFSLVLLLPISIAYARRLWKRTSPPIALPPEVGDRLANLERGVEAVAIEVERLGEGQRFVTQLLAESDRRRQALAAESTRPGNEL